MHADLPKGNVGAPADEDASKKNTSDDKLRSDPEEPAVRGETAAAAATAADDDEDESAGWGFGSSWGMVSNSLFGVVKKDLEEFQQNASVLASDVGGMFSGVAKAIQNKLSLEEAKRASDRIRDGVSTVITSINDTLAYEAPDDEDDDELDDEVRVRIRRLQSDSSTYLDQVDNEKEFELFLTAFDLEVKRRRIEKLLDECTALREHFESLVPDRLSELDFWARYFYRVERLLRQRRRLLAATATQRANEEESASTTTIQPTREQRDEGASSSQPSVEPGSPADDAAESVSLSNDSFQMVDGGLNSREDSQIFDPEFDMADDAAEAIEAAAKTAQ